MSMQAEYDYMQSGQWADSDPKVCPCRGAGWLLSDLDTWHKCPRHHTSDTRHPDDDYDDDSAHEPTTNNNVTQHVSVSFDVDDDLPF